MILEIKDLSVTYRSPESEMAALKKVDLSLEKGEVLGVVGESGSGKSTLAFSILNLLPFDARRKGEIIFKGENIFSLSEAESENLRGKEIGLIFQDPAATFNPVLSIGYQFEEVLKTRLNLQNGRERKEIMEGAFKRVRLNDSERIAKSYPYQLSGGQLQRAAIALAIALKPAVLIADEPTSSLDVSVESRIIYLFKELKETLDLTLLFITHNLMLVKVLCDRAAVLCEGTVREVAETKKLFSAPQDSYTKSLLYSFEELMRDVGRPT